MSLREYVLQSRVDALEESLQVLTIAIQQNLPAISSQCDVVHQIMTDCLVMTEKTKAKKMNIDRIDLWRKGAISQQSLQSILGIFVSILLDLNIGKKYLTHDGNTSGYGLDGRDKYKLDVTGILGHISNLSLHTSMTCSFNYNKDTHSVYQIDVSHRDYYEGQIESYHTLYDMRTTPIFESELMNWMMGLLKEEGYQDHWLHRINCNSITLSNTLRGLLPTLTDKLKMSSYDLDENDIRIKLMSSSKSGQHSHYIRLLDGGEYLNISMMLEPNDVTNFKSNVTLTLDYGSGNQASIRVISPSTADRTTFSDLTLLETIKLSNLIHFLTSYIDAPDPITEWTDQNNITFNVTVEEFPTSTDLKV